MKEFIEEWAFVIWLILATVGMGWIAFSPYPSVQAAEPLKVSTPEPVKPCIEWMTAGAQVIFKCVDEEPPYATCYSPVGGVMQCLKE
jgi:hypothetical protein